MGRGTTLRSAAAVVLPWVLATAPAAGATFVKGQVGVGGRVTIGSQSKPGEASKRANALPADPLFASPGSLSLQTGSGTGAVLLGASATWESAMKGRFELAWGWVIDVPGAVQWKVETNSLSPNWLYSFVPRGRGVFTLGLEVTKERIDGFPLDYRGLGALAGRSDLPPGPHGGDDKDPSGKSVMQIQLRPGRVYTVAIANRGTRSGTGPSQFYGAAIAKGVWEITYQTAAGAIPEPSSWAMMIAGFGLVGAALRRRARPASGSCGRG